MSDLTQEWTPGDSRGSTGTRGPRPSQALAPTGGATTTQIALQSGAQLNRWPVPKDYVPLDAEAFQRSSQSLFNKPTATGMWIGLGVSAGLALLAGLCFLLLGVVGAAIATGVISVGGIALSLTIMPKVFEKMNDSAGVKLFRDIDVYLTGYFYGFGLGQFLFLAPMFAVVCLTLKR